MTTFYNHLCSNCKVWLQESDPDMCPACIFLLTHPYENNQRGTRGETEGFVNRRWQMRFNNGELRYER